jgi:hypothetical protein
MLLHGYFRSRWLLTVPIAAGVVWFAWACQQSYPDGMTGGSTLGLWCGIGGMACLLAAFFVLPWQRRKARLLQPGFRRSFWLRGHLWLSLLAAALILAHTGFCQNWTRLGGLLETVLMLFFALTLLTGVLGMGLQHWLPSLLRPPATDEIPIGQLSEECRALRGAADELVMQILVALPDQAKKLQEDYLNQVRPFLQDRLPWYLSSWKHQRRPPERFGQDLSQTDQQAITDTLDKLKGICKQRRRLFRQQCLHSLLHAWLYVHVPAAVALVSLALIHAIASLSF